MGVREKGGYIDASAHNHLNTFLKADTYFIVCKYINTLIQFLN